MGVSGLGVRVCYPPWYHKDQLSFLMSPRVRLCCKAAEITVINTGVSHVTQQIRKTSSFFFFSLFSHYQTPKRYQTLTTHQIFPRYCFRFWGKCNRERDSRGERARSCSSIVWHNFRNVLSHQSRKRQMRCFGRMFSLIDEGTKVSQPVRGRASGAPHPQPRARPSHTSAPVAAIHLSPP